MTPDKIFKKSLLIAYSLFRPNRIQQNYHFSFGFAGNKIIGIGQNEPFRPDSKALRIAKRFGNMHFQSFPFLHAETDLIARLWGKHYIDKKLTLVNVRLNKKGKLMKSKPCNNCQQILDALGITKIYWTNQQNSFDTK